MTVDLKIFQMFFYIECKLGFWYCIKTFLQVHLKEKH